ncbi:MAG: histidine kinase [Clostridia bacterium]|nr:histidine kinase [Clostridia bacterium]
MISIAVAIVGIVLYTLTTEYDVLMVIMIAKFCEGIYRIKKEQHFVFRRTPFFAASVLCVVLGMTGIFIPELRFTGIGFANMYLILSVEIQIYAEKELSKSKAELAENKFRLLNEQISSHFVFHSLKVIEDMCEPDPGRAKQMINTFSKYLRSNLESITGDSMIPFEEELEHTRQYIALEQSNSTAAFAVEYDFETTDFVIPPISLQPLVENAIRHGVRGFGADIVVITTRIEEDDVCISVSDNGRAHFMEGSTHRSIALDNIRNRLRSQCGGTLTVDHSEEGTNAVIKMPLN